MKLRVYRDNLNYATKIRVVANDNEIGEIGFNDNYKDFEIDEVNVKLSTKVQWCSSNEIILVNETNEVYVSSRINLKKSLIIVFLVVFFGFMALMVSKYFLVLMILVYLYPFYYITIGKSDYLVLKQQLN
jgi:hypothetical protein